MTDADARKGWDAASAGWATHAEALGRATMPVSEWLIDALAPQPGHTILELACGTGEVGLLAAELVQPGGEVILSDFSPGMLTAAQERAAARGLTNVRFKQIDAQSIDWPAGTLDGIVCRFGYMLMPDGEAALRETRRVLRSGRNVALAVWAQPDRNPWRMLIEDVAIEAGRIEPPERGTGPFAWGEEGVLAEHLEAAGFVDYAIEPIEFTMPQPSLDAWITNMREVSVYLRPALEDLGDLGDAIATAAEPYTQPDGTLLLPARVWGAWAAA